MGRELSQGAKTRPDFADSAPHSCQIDRLTAAPASLPGPVTMQITAQLAASIDQNPPNAANNRSSNLLRGAWDYSLEITAKDSPDFALSSGSLIPSTQVSITFLPGEDEDARVRAAGAVRAAGFEPMPHLSARRLQSREALTSYLGALQKAAAPNRAFVVAGDPATPLGPYEDALALIRTGRLSEFGIKTVGISGYPDGHPQIDEARLWNALSDKLKALSEMGHEAEIVTQFGFDAAPFLTWTERLRDAGIVAPVRIGVPGPATVQTLIRFAARCGVGASAKVMSKYGVSLSRLLQPAGPDRLIDALEAGLDTRRHGDVRLHFYPFGGISRLADWIGQNTGQEAGHPLR